MDGILHSRMLPLLWSRPTQPIPAWQCHPSHQCWDVEITTVPLTESMKDLGLREGTCTVPPRHKLILFVLHSKQLEQFPYVIDQFLEEEGIPVPMGHKNTGIVIPHQELWHTPLLCKYLAEKVISCLHKWCDGWFWRGHVHFQGAFIEHWCSCLQGCKCYLTNHCNVNFLQVGEKDLGVDCTVFFEMNETMFCLTALYALFCFVLF